VADAVENHEHAVPVARFRYGGHEVRRRAGCRQIAEVITQAAGLDHLGGSQQNTAVVNTGS